MTTRSSKAETYIDHELTVAGRYRWWGVYLIREKRRLQSIADAVQAGEAAAALRQPVHQPEVPAAGGRSATPEELLARVDAELGPAKAEGGEGADTHGDTARKTQVIPEDRLRRRLAGRAKLLAGRQDEPEDDEDF